MIDLDALQAVNDRRRAEWSRNMNSEQALYPPNDKTEITIWDLAELLSMARRTAEAEVECDAYRIGRDIDRQDIARLEAHIAREAQGPDPDAPSPAFERWRCRAHTAESAAARRLEVLKSVECHAHECPRCHGDETFDGVGNRWYVAHKPGCELARELETT